MAPKRLLEENPPSASSSEEEEDEEEGEVESEQEEPKPKSKPIPPPKAQSSDDEEEEGSEEGSDEDEEEDKEKADPAADEESESGSEDSDNEPVKHMIAPRNVEVKPISSKPMNEPPKPKKPSVPEKKRPLEAVVEKNNKSEKRDRKKKKVSDLVEDHDEGTEKKSGGEDKFLRKWSEQDEIVLLEGLIEFKKKGNNTSTKMTNLSALLDSIKDSLQGDFNVEQTRSKVQRLVKKYNNNARRAKPGEDPVISNPHELMSYKLSKLIWAEQSDGGEGSNGGGESDGKKSKKKVNSNGTVVVASPRKKVVAVSDKSPKVEAKEDENGSGSSEYHYLNQSLHSGNQQMWPVPPSPLGNICAMKGWNSDPNLNAEALDKRWKSVVIAEGKAYLERLDLVRDQTKMMLDALQSNDA